LEGALQIFELHASVNMRCMVSPVRSDMLGERMAIMCHIMHLQSATQWHHEVFDDMKTQLNMLLDLAANAEEFAPLLEKLAQPTAVNLRDFWRAPMPFPAFRK
jgi:hypothetical protein